MGGRNTSDLDDPTAPSGQRLAADDEGTEPTSHRDTLPGQMLGEYRVIEQLGHGGMGALYRGVQPVIDKQVAIKVLLPAGAHDPTSTQRMIVEARAANAVRHPNIIDIFSFGTLPDGRPYMVMELLEGRSLAEELRARERLTPQQVLVVLEQAMSALEAAHAAGVVHRDLKPENIFVTESTDGWRLKLIDFGLAREQDSGESRLTRPGLVMGTPGFMAPEQVRGEANVSGQADVYAMGVVAWTLLMGREPYEGGSVVEIMHRHLSAPVPALVGIPDAPEGLEALVLRMMDKAAVKRPDASEVRRLVAALQSAKPAGPPSGPGRAIAALAALAAVIVVSTVAILKANEEPQPVPEPPRPKPVIVAAPPKPVEPVQPVAPVEPVAVELALPAGAVRAWECRIANVGPVLTDVNKWKFFQVTFPYGSNLLVYTGPKNVKRLKEAADAAAACKPPKRLAARRVDVQHTGFHTTLFNAFGGEVVELNDFFVAH